MVRLKSIFQGLIAFLLIGALLLPVISYAQTPSEIIISYPQQTDIDGMLELGLYFAVLDNGGRVIPETQIKSAQILLDDGERDDNAVVEQPTTPFYITLVLDASGSMAGAAEDMRQAAIQAVNDAPEEAQFAVIRFNEGDAIDDLTQGFSPDRNRAINAIGEVVPVNQAGTCLYDATYTAIELLSKAPPGRRAIILFTDGKDEVLSGAVCSTHTFDQVVEFATGRTSRVPVYTIGMTTSALDPTVLRNLATQTGGSSAIGEQQALGDLFKQIMDSLKSQWLAKGMFCPTAGTHSATLTVFLNDDTRLSAVTDFEVAPPGYTCPDVSTPAPTPVQVNVRVLSVTSDISKDEVALEVVVVGQENIGEFRFDFFNSDTNQLLDRQIRPAPLSVPVTLSASKLDGDIRVEVRALDRNGQIMTWAGERQDETVDKAVYEFAYIRPTPTPPPASATPIPVAVEINSISYNRETDIYTLDLSINGLEQINNLQISVSNADTGLAAKTEDQAPAETIEFSAAGFQADQEYRILIIAQDATGQTLYRSRVLEFSYDPVRTPTPVPTMTATPEPSAEPVQLTFVPAIDDANQQLVFSISASGQDRITRLQLQLNNDTGLLIGVYDYTSPPYDSIRVPLANIAGGKYVALLRVYGADGTLLAEAGPLNFAYTPPPTPTPVPTGTPLPSPTPTPTPSLPERIGNAVRDNPALAVVVAVVGLALVIVLFLIVRPRKKSQTGTDFLSAQTGFYQMSPSPSGSPPASSSSALSAPAHGGDPATMMASLDPEKTDVFPQALPPVASLRFSQSADGRRTGEVVPLTHFPFRIGRGSSEPNELRLDEDTSVSRRHATITYENATFYITDENSSNGSAVEGKRLMPNTPVALQDGARIMIGKGTVLIFEMAGYNEGGSDPDKTDYLFNTSR